MTNDLILRVSYNGSIYDLDINSDIPLRLDMSAVENQSLGNVFGIGSQTFDLPGTKKNNRFFNHGYDVSQQDIPAFYNSISAWVILNGETVLEGSLQLQEIVTSEDGYVTYKVSVIDKVVLFKQNLASKLIRNGNWSRYNHTLTSGSIVDSWTNNLLSGSIFYPLADYGRPDPDTFPNIPLVMLGVSGSANPGDINSTSTPMRVEQFLPAVRLKDVFDVIFEQVGFDYTGSFVSGSNWEQLYVLPKAIEGLGIASVAGIENTVNYQRNTEQILGTVGGGTPSIQVDFLPNLEISDPGNNFNTGTGMYIAPQTGEYTFNVTVTVSNETDPNDNPDSAYILRLYSGSAGGGADTVLASSAPYYFVYNGPPYGARTVTWTGTLNIGDPVYANIEIDDYFSQPESQEYFTMAFGNAFQVTVAPETFEGAPVDMSQQWGDTKSIDLLKGVIEHFNLILEHDPYNPNVIKIETFLDWIRQGEIKDWTDKYNTAKRISINHTIDEQPKELLLQDQEDSDRFSKQTKEQEPNYQYGTLRILADNNISQGEKKIGSFFGPIVLGSQIDSASIDPIQNIRDYDLALSSDFVFPHLYKFDNKKQTAFKFKPRIGYKVTNEINDSFYIGSPSHYIDTTGSYATISNLNSIDPVISGSSLDLHYNNTYGAFTNGIANINGGVSNYQTYWSDYIQSLYWTDNKKVTLDLYFEPYEYKSIRLNDRIQIKNQMYRINKISGYNITNRDVVTVELIKLYPAFWQLTELETPPAPSSTPTPTPTPSLTATPTLTPTPTPTLTSSPTLTVTPTPTPTAGLAPCYTYYIENYDLVETMTYRYLDCSDCTTYVTDQTVLPDSTSPSFCACSGSVEQVSGNDNNLIVQEEPFCIDGLSTIYRSTLKETCSDFCTSNYAISSASYADNPYASLSIGDTIYGLPATAGYYAYSSTNTDTTTGPFRIAEVNTSGVVQGIDVCSGGSCVPL